MTPMLRLLGLAVALIATVAITQASVLRMRLSPSDAAVLRLAWTARPDRVEDCRSQTEEQLSKLPAHMRQTVVCEGTTASYRLEVRYQGGVIAEQVVRGGGLRHDRPLYVSRDIQLPPGNADISVKFVRLESAPASTLRDRSPNERDDEGHSTAIDDGRRRRELEERIRGREEAIPSSLLLERHLQLKSRKVVLVTYDAERRDLAVVEEVSR